MSLMNQSFRAAVELAFSMNMAAFQGKMSAAHSRENSMLRILFPGQKLPSWAPYEVAFSYHAENDGQGIRIGCLAVAWRYGGHVSLRTIFGGSILVIETGGAQVKLPVNDKLWLYSSPLIPLRYGASIEIRRKGRTIEWVGHTDDLKEVH